MQALLIYGQLMKNRGAAKKDPKSTNDILKILAATQTSFAK